MKRIKFNQDFELGVELWNELRNELGHKLWEELEEELWDNLLNELDWNLKAPIKLLTK